MHNAETLNRLKTLEIVEVETFIIIKTAYIVMIKICLEMKYLM